MHVSFSHSPTFVVSPYSEQISTLSPNHQQPLTHSPVQHSHIPNTHPFHFHTYPTLTRSTRTPSLVSLLAMKPPLVSWVVPRRISSPITVGGGAFLSLLESCVSAITTSPFNQYSQKNNEINPYFNTFSPLTYNSSRWIVHDMHTRALL